MSQENIATKKDLHTEIDKLARMVADGFATMATKKELARLETRVNAGFDLIMENLVPLRHDYEALKDDLAPQVALLDARLTKVERKIGS